MSVRLTAILNLQSCENVGCKWDCGDDPWAQTSPETKEEIDLYVLSFIYHFPFFKHFH